MRAICALAVLLAAVVFNLQWIWGILFLFWSAQSLVAGVTFLVEPVYRDENPRLFWAIAMLWFGLSAGAHRQLRWQGWLVRRSPTKPTSMSQDSMNYTNPLL